MRHSISFAICALACLFVSIRIAQAQNTSTLINFNTNGTQVTRFDSVAAAIDAHDGEIAYFDGVFYLYGTSYDCGYEWGISGAPFGGFKAYSSTDLVNWTDRGFLFDAQTAVWQSRCNGSTYGCYRPHVVYNKANHLYVLWINVYDNRVGYRVFTSSNPVGPFTEIAQPALAVNANAPVAGLNNGDHDLFVDDDDTAYLAYTDWRTGGAIVIEKLNADYTSGTGQYVYVTTGATEAPAIMKRNGKYYILYSDPNRGYDTTGTSYRTATSPLAPWSDGIKISTDSCGGQPSFVSTIKLDSEVIFLYGSDLWNHGAKNEAVANFYWAPLTFAADGSINPITCQDKISVAIQPDTSPQPPLADLDNSSGTDGFTSYYDIVGNVQRSQSFVATRTGALSAVSVGTFQTGHPDAGLTIEIHQASNAGLPTGSPLSSILVLPDAIGWSPKLITVHPEVAVQAGVTYAIVLKSASSTGSYGFEYSDAAPYPAGQEAYSNNGGNTFSVEPNRSFMFRTFIRTLNIITTNQTGSGSGTFYPDWTVQTNGSLIAGQLPSTATGNFSLEAPGRSVGALTMSNDLGITLIGGNNGVTSSTNYVTCGNAGGAGYTLIYSLPNNAFGYDLTNITVYGGWAGNERDQQAYTVYYSTIDAPATFIQLGNINYNPAVGLGVQSATRVTLASSSGILVTKVAAVKFDFTSPASENGYCGYGAIQVFGVPTISLPAITVDTLPVTAMDVVGSSVTFTVGVSGKSLSCQWQKISGVFTNDIVGATNSTLTLNNLQLSDSGNYRLRITNVYGLAVSTPRSLTVSSVPAPVNNVITMVAAQTGTGSGTFVPTWTLDVGSLNAGQPPSSSGGNFSLEAPGRSVAALTVSNDLGITLINGPNGITSSTNYVTCGNGYGAGSSIVYTLAGSTNGYNLTNITVYGGWASNGRDQQAYTVSYAKVAAPSTFVTLGTVNYNPPNLISAQSATRVKLTAATGFLATNVVAVKFDFTTPASENGYCGYGQIGLFGTTNIPPVVPVTSGAIFQPGQASFIMNLGSLVVGRNYMMQSTTNLGSSVWSTETNFVATQSTAAFTNSAINSAQKFYRIVGY